MIEEDFIYYFVDLYNSILFKEKERFNVGENAIIKAIRIMKDVYLPDPKWKTKTVHSGGRANFNSPAFRCAYLHKHAMCHTGLVYHLWLKAIDNSPAIRLIIKSKKQQIRLCSLGGGPGTDIIGSLAALSKYLVEFVPWSVTVVDSAREWRSSFNMILQELQSLRFGNLHRMATNFCSDTEYLCANLLEDWTEDYLVTQTISTADIIMVVKFISAASCNFYTEAMIKRICNHMKPGAILLFIDNAAGGFYEMVKEVAMNCGMNSLYGPLTHYEYADMRFSINRFGYTSQSHTRITFEIFQKAQESFFNRSLSSHLEDSEEPEEMYLNRSLTCFRPQSSGDAEYKESHSDISQAYEQEGTQNTDSEETEEPYFNRYLSYSQSECNEESKMSPRSSVSQAALHQETQSIVSEELNLYGSQSSLHEAIQTQRKYSEENHCIQIPQDEFENVKPRILFRLLFILIVLLIVSLIILFIYLFKLYV